MLKTDDPLKRLLLSAVGMYRAASFVVIFIITLSLSGEGGTSFGSFRFVYITFLSCCTVLYFVLIAYKKILAVVLGLEYFFVFFFPYVESPFLVMELLWIPGIIAAAALFLPQGICRVVIPSAGILGPLLFSYGAIYHVSVLVGETALPYTAIALFLYVPLTLLLLLLNHVYYRMERMEKRYSSLGFENTRLNEINQAISQRIFSLQNDTTQKERNRLSKEIHDTAGYVFINLIMMLQAAHAILYRDIKKADKLVGDARDYAERGINEIRHLLSNIRDYTPVRISLQNELHDVGESFQRATDVAIDIDYGPWPQSLPKNLDSFFISFMQEALTNALKHGHATHVSVLCWDNGERIGMSIIDNGAGAKFPIKKGIGITAMEDVVNELGGSIIIKSDGGGFQINAAVPAVLSPAGTP